MATAFLGKGHSTHEHKRRFNELPLALQPNTRKSVIQHEPAQTRQKPRQKDVKGVIKTGEPHFQKHLETV